MSAKQINQELDVYLHQHIKSEGSVKKLLEQYHMEVFFPGIFDNSIDQTAINIFKKRRFQKYMSAIAEIKSIFDKNNVSFVVMKGLGLALDLYHDEPYQRTFGDIDILVLPEQLATVIALLRIIGYKCTNDLSVEDFLSEPNHEHHFPSLFKNGGMLGNIMLEVHVDAVPKWMFQMNQSYTDKILRHSYVNVYDIPVMDDYDTIIFLMQHLLKHYIFEMLMGVVSGNAEAEIDLRALHETALFIDKASKSISKDVVKRRVSEYKTGNELALICRMITDVYPSLADFLTFYIASDNRACFSNRFSGEALKIETQQILFGRKREFLCNIIRKLQQDAYILPCYKVKSDRSASAHTVIMDNNRCPNDNRFGTYADVLNNSLKTECKISFYVEWDKDLFWFHMTAEDKDFTFLNCNPETLRQTIGVQDCFRLHFDTGNREANKAFVRGILLKPQYDESNRLILFLKEDIMGNNAETELEQTEYISTVNYDNNLVNIDLGLPWSRLGYKPQKGFAFFFDVQVWKYCEKYDRHVILTWQDAYKPWYDITTYAKVILVDNSDA